MTGGAESSGFEDTESTFAVTNPIKMQDTTGLVKVGQVVKYTVTGQDSEGRFEVQRRYNEFLALNQ